jgi:hypothetical protein
VNAIDIADLLYLSTINASWGYSFSWKKYLLSFRLPNIEFAFLERRPELEKLIEINESYKYIFNDGFISSSIAGLTINGGHKRVTNITHFNLEASGLVAGLIHSKFTDSNLKRFIRLDGDFRQNRKLGRTSIFAWRVFAGAGYSMPLFKTDTSNFALPFFRAYSAGGSNSMRAWRLRRLGPGSTVRSFDPGELPERFGDIQLELNAEYRFLLTELGVVKVNSAFFTDIGNIWTMRKNKDFIGGEFRFDKVLKDIAVGAGAGLRLDFGFFLFRVDASYILKDPSPADIRNQNKFFPYRRLKDGRIQLGVNYPF